MVSRLIHPQMMTRLQRDFLPQRCELSEPESAQDTAGQMVNDPDPRYRDIPCRVGPARGGKRFTSQQIYANVTHTIVISGQFQELNDTWTARVDGQVYEILLVTPDAEGILTELLVRIVE